MKTKIGIAVIVLTTIYSCSSDKEACRCTEYYKSSNGSLTLYGEANMSFCDGTVPNPTPKIVTYKKECN